MAGEFSVALFLSHPDNENDDCVTGVDFDTLAEAEQCIADIIAYDAHCISKHPHFNMPYFRDTPFIMLDGPGVHRTIERHGIAKRAKREDSLDRSEIAMQAGMAGGCDAYNEAMGWDTDTDGSFEDDMRGFYEPEFDDDMDGGRMSDADGRL